MKGQDSSCPLQRTLTVGELWLPCRSLRATSCSNRRAWPRRIVQAALPVAQDLSAWHSAGLCGRQALTGHRKITAYHSQKVPDRSFQVSFHRWETEAQ